MKKIIYLFSILLLGISAQAQFINYQGVARDNAGNILINQPIALRLSVLSGSAVGTAVFVETHATSTDAYGLFTLKIGQGTVVTGVFNNIAWSSTSFFLKVEIDPTGGTNYGLAGTTQFAAVPYSLHAKTADNGFSGNYNDLTNQPMLFDGAFGSLTGKPSTLAGYGITDAMNTSHAANGITNDNIANWDAAYSWGNHATAGYLTSFTESDPIFNSHPASGISGADIGNWTTAYSWGNHATAGYLTSFTETDPVFISHPASGITGADIGNWNMAYNWGNHATAGYLTSFTETDPIFGAWDKSSGIVIASSQVSDFETSVTNTPAVLANTAKNSYPTEDAAKLAGIAAGAEVNVNADWNATSGDAQLLNKPILATVATTGSYNDLDNKPTQWDSTWSSIKNKPTGTNPGDMLYWNGTQWLPVPVGTEGQVLRLNGGIPTWGSSVQFASIITTAISGIGATTAISGGNLSDGGAPVTARGVCWGTTAGPTIEGSKTTDGIGSGAFTSNITGLSMATTYHVRAYATNRKGTAYGDELSFTTAAWQCGTSAITVNHLASGGVAPVDKSVSYATVTNIPGETDKCWITKNLGATNQATSVSDATEEAAGWYWQFNKPQGYKHDGTTRTPASTWINNVSENSDWLPSNDPCTLELGSAWRLPTNTEWTNIDASGNWTSWNEPYASSLKLHAAGGLYTSDGSLYNRGSYGQCWSSTQGNVTQGWFQVFNSGYSHQGLDAKTYGYSVRCLTGTSNTMTTATVTTTPVTGITTTAASSGGNVENDGGSSVTARGVCWNTTANPTITDTKTTDGSGTGTFSSSITGLTESTTYHVRAYATNSSGTAYGDDVSFVTIPFICGSSTLTVNHIAGEVAPVDKTTTYGTVTNIPGEPTKCWITKNLGATNQATSVDDASEASAGWYWQFNRKQGYKHDGTTRTPATAWIGSLPESSDWVAANDPCTIELGSGWRVPTIAEWTNVDASGGWTTWYGPFDSGLKIHAAGFLSTAGSVNWRGIMGYYWSSSLYDVGNGSILHFTSGNSNNDYGAMTYGFPARCLSGTSNTMTTATVTTTAVTGITSNTASTGGNVESDGGSSVTARGVCWSTTANPTITDTKTNDGSGTGTFSSSITGLTASTTYHVRAYATNSAGTAYGNDVSFVTSPFTCGSTLTINHVAGEVAPVDKTTTYGTVTNIPGEPTKCWITKNLGATNQATSVDDASEASAGWYWQFNKKQGYKHDGTTCTPATTWINSISENSDWLASNDPCTIELGGGWRLPTILEWNNLTASGGWTGWDGPYSSGLKLHAAGWLTTDGLFLHRGSLGRYWSSTQNEEINGWSLYFHPSIIFPTFDNKAIGLSVRCLRD